MDSNRLWSLLTTARLPVSLLLMGILLSCSRPAPVIPAEDSPQTSPLSRFGGGACEISALTGFHPPETWGTWSANDPAEIMLKSEVNGTVKMQFSADTLGDRASHELQIRLGDITKTITLTPTPKKFDLTYSLSGPAQKIILSGITPRSTPTAGRLLGV